jgi:hypothetical protein
MSLFTRSFLLQEVRAHVGAMDVRVAVGAELKPCCRVVSLDEGLTRRGDLRWEMT